MSDDMNVKTMLADQLERLLSRMVSRTTLVAVEQGKPATALWEQLEALGITLALVPEEAGGAGLAWANAEVLLRLLGSHALPLPLGETMVAASILASAGLEVPCGPLAIATTVMELDAHDKVSGTDPLVPWAGQSGHILTIARSKGKAFVCLLQRDDVQLAAQETIGRIPSDRLTLNQASPVQLAPAGADIGELGLLPHVAVLRTLQIAGALDRILPLCVEYANTRVQFGKPISKFQAIQHMIAELATLTAAAQVAALFACRRIDANDAAFGAAVAKARVGKSAGRAAEIAHQVFGAIGVTDEHMLHYFTRRLWQWRTEAGSEHWWSERLGRQMLANKGAALWPAIAR